MAVFNSYVKLPEGIYFNVAIRRILLMLCTTLDNPYDLYQNHADILGYRWIIYNLSKYLNYPDTLQSPNKISGWL